MEKASNVQVVVVASNGPVGILKDLGIQPEVLDYVSRFASAAGSEIHVDGDFFSNLDLFIERSGDEELKKKALLLKKRYDFKFLNGIILKSFLEKRGFRVGLINDLEFEKEELAAFLKEKPVAVVLSTTFLPTRNSVQDAVSVIKSVDPDVKVVAGGPHIYYSYKIQTEYDGGENAELLQRVFFFQGGDFNGPHAHSPDVFIIDKRGLKTLEAVLLALRKESSLDQIPNAAFRDTDGRLHLNPVRPEDYSPFDDMPDWGSIEEAYLGPRVSVQGSIGCPYKCKFCNFYLFFDKFKLKSLETLRNELRAIARRGVVRHVRFTDDNLFFNPKSVEDFCSMLVEEDFPFTWSSFIRCDSITPNTAEMLKRSKATHLLFGMESGDARVLRNMSKRTDPGRYLKAVQLLNENGISTESNLMVGFPGETEASVGNTIDLLERMNGSGDVVNWFSPFVFIIFPMAPIDFEREKYGLEGLFTTWKHETMTSSEAFGHFIDMLFQVESLVVSDRFLTPDYEILSKEEVYGYSQHRGRLSNLVFRLKESGGADADLARQRDAEIRRLKEISLNCLKRA